MWAYLSASGLVLAGNGEAGERGVKLGAGEVQAVELHHQLQERVVEERGELLGGAERLERLGGGVAHSVALVGQRHGKGEQERTAQLDVVLTHEAAEHRQSLKRA